MSTDHQSLIEEQVERVLMIERVTDPSCEHQFSSSPFPCQVLSPLAKNLFHRAISESGVALTPVLFGKNVRPLAEVGLTLDGVVPFLCCPGIFRGLSSCVIYLRCSRNP
jgi:hypothetical protein